MLTIETDKELKETAGKLLALLYTDNRETWNFPELYDICRLSVEYLTLDGLEDARRGRDIEYLLIDGTAAERRNG